ncbi:aspartate aminotransferase family protein [Paenibacillus harenae]|uniref:Acetylornithine/N-succinyldiaminopimelate aminotransferase n=1 Tax=Paenibacillus harenae TaxID=306543 RepID=A0ABT9TVZ3_PAEHA|nr:acetylornithine/succinylornithine family transaminase [Paenibacillus harenae]MDQ0111056.1 acetylornithine/N-succinyldiaminopimelate aminotransferase [Paenibacillus harenae]
MLQTTETTETTQTNGLLAEADKSILFTTKRPHIIMERGEGMYMWDTEGKRYLDFIAGWAVNALGHSPAVLRDALAKQSSTLVHASPAFYNKPMIQFAELLTNISGMDKAFFASSGAEANESAIKLARKHGAMRMNGAYEIITVTNGFHGRTLAMMSATGKPEWETLFAPKVDGFKHVPINDLDACFAAVNNHTCAIMLELIQGEGGVNAVDEAYLYGLRKICDMYGMPLIIDEIQTGLGRTGKLFAYEHYDIKPDILTLGKAIGGGFPLSAMLTTDKYDIFEQGNQGGTYTGSPLAMAAGHAVVQEIVASNLARNAELQGRYLKSKLQQLSGELPISGIRGKGLLIAFDVPQGLGPKLVDECQDNGLLINALKSSVIRLMPALIVTREDIDGMIAILHRAFNKLLTSA